MGQIISWDEVLRIIFVVQEAWLVKYFSLWMARPASFFYETASALFCQSVVAQ